MGSEHPTINTSEEMNNVVLIIMSSFNLLRGIYIISPIIKRKKRDTFSMQGTVGKIYSTVSVLLFQYHYIYY